MASALWTTRGRTIWIADAHRGDGKRYVVRADEKLTAFMQPEAATRFAVEIVLMRSNWL